MLALCHVKLRCIRTYLDLDAKVWEFLVRSFGRLLRQRNKRGNCSSKGEAMLNGLSQIAHDTTQPELACLPLLRNERQC